MNQDCFSFVHHCVFMLISFSQSTTKEMLNSIVIVQDIDISCLKTQYIQKPGGGY